MSSLPLYEVVDISDYSHVAARRLRVAIAISPEDLSQASVVAHHVVEEHAGPYDIAMLFFYPSHEATVAGEAAALLRAQYIRHGMQPGFRPPPLASPYGTVEIDTGAGLLIVERTANA